ncbi:hypothetical protein [Pseudomonas sp. PA15(2017)]
MLGNTGRCAYALGTLAACPWCITAWSGREGPLSTLTLLSRTTKPIVAS